MGSVARTAWWSFKQKKRFVQSEPPRDGKRRQAENSPNPNVPCILLGHNIFSSSTVANGWVSNADRENATCTAAT